MWSTFTIVMSTIANIGFGTVSAYLTIIPKDTVVKVGETTFLNCSTKLSTRKINWFHGSNYVYAGGPVFEQYSDRFRIENSSEGAYNLVIQSVEIRDAGKYLCQDSFEEVKNSSELIVIEKDPVCTSNINPTEMIESKNCSLKQDPVELNCAVSYGGNTPPEMVWKRQGERTNIKKGVTMTSDNKTVTYTLVINASDLRNIGHSFICETTQATAIQYECSTPVIKILCALIGSTKVTHLDTSDALTEESLISTWVIIVALVASGILMAVLVVVVCFIKRRPRRSRLNENSIPISSSVDRSTKAKQLWLISHKTQISAMSVSEDEIYILTHKPIRFEIYAILQHSHLGSRSLDSVLTQPHDMAYGHKSQRLYVTDGRPTVEKQPTNMVVLDRRGKRITSWPTNARFGNISVAAIDGNIILAYPEGIEEYSPGGKLIRGIRMQDSFIPLCSIKVSDYEFLISRGKKSCDLFEVCLVKISEHPAIGNIHSVEQTEKSFGKYSRLKYFGLKDQHSLAVFENRDVAVLDEEKNCVVILDSELTLKREILLDHYKLQSSVKLCVAENNKHLIIAGNYVEGASNKGPGILILPLK